MGDRKALILLRRESFSGEVVVAHRHGMALGVVHVANDWKQNITADFNDLLWETLFMAHGEYDDDGVEDINSPDIIKALDYAVQLMLEHQGSDHEALDLASQTDAFRKRLIKIAVEHNERCAKQDAFED